MKSSVFLISQILILFASLISAQSGRTLPSADPTVLDDVNAKTSSEKQAFPPCENQPEEFIYISPGKIKEFTAALNRFGRCGYRLEHSAKIPLLRVERLEENIFFFGVMRLDAPNKYEYQWFEAYAPGETQTRMNYRASEGFYFRAGHSFRIDRGYAGAISESDLPIFNGYASGSIYIFERRNEDKTAREYRILDGWTALGGSVEKRNQTALDEVVKKGFRIVGITNYVYDYLIAEKDGEIIPQGEYLILTENFGLLKKVKELSSSGYKLEFIGQAFAVVHRTNGAPISGENYKAVYFPEKLASKLKNHKSVKYRLSGQSPAGKPDLTTDLYFEVSDDAQENLYEYRLLKMTDVAGRLKAEKDYDAIRKKPSAEMLKAFEKALKDGYKIRELLAYKEIYLLLERPVINIKRKT